MSEQFAETVRHKFVEHVMGAVLFSARCSCGYSIVADSPEQLRSLCTEHSDGDARG